MVLMVQGKMRMVGANTVQGQDELEMLRLAAAVEGSTRHPLADAVLLAANQKHLQVCRWSYHCRLQHKPVMPQIEHQSPARRQCCLTRV